MRQVCPKCANDEVEMVPMGPGLHEFTCNRVKKHRDGEPYVWQGTSEGPLSDTEGQGPVPINDVREALLSCLKAGEPWLEYGIVEERYMEVAPQDFAILHEEYGHKFLEPKSKGGYTVSGYLARALGDLREFGQVAHMTDDATGPWKHNGKISYWAVPPPGPLHNNKLTYAEHSMQQGASGSHGPTLAGT